MLLNLIIEMLNIHLLNRLAKNILIHKIFKKKYDVHFFIFISFNNEIYYPVKVSYLRANTLKKETLK